MSQYSCSQFRLLPKRQPFAYHALSRPSHRHISVNHAKREARIQETPVREPTPSQILRFALTGSTQRLQSDRKKHKLDQQLQDLFLQEWPSGSPPPPSWGSSSQKATESETKAFLPGVRRLLHLTNFIEKKVTGAESGALLQMEECKPLAHALKRCQRYDSPKEILSAINGVEHRLKRLEVRTSQHLHVLGMRYACSCLCVPALRHHLEGYYNATSEKLDAETSVLLVNTVLSSIKSVQIQNPHYNTDPILDLVIGKGAHNQSSRHTLQDILCWTSPKGSTKYIEKYIQLLAMRRTDEYLQKVWRRLLLEITATSSSGAFQSIYSCMMAMVDPKDPETAIKYLRAISKRAGDTLPEISKFQELNSLLANTKVSALLPQLSGKQEYLEILNNQLYNIEARLGINWQPKSSLHASVSDPFCVASEKPLVDMDEDYIGFGSSKRLVAEIRASGCSNSLATLGGIADLLDEHDGIEIPVYVPGSCHTSSEYAWFPQRSSIEFSNSLLPERTNMSMPWAPNTLGLIRVRFDNDEALAKKHSLRLMQLGYIAMRTTPRPGAHPEKQDAWKESGHIVAWDRDGGQFLAVFIGKGYGVVDPGTQPQLLRISSGLGAIANVTLLSDLDNLSPQNSVPHSVHSGARYHIKVDSCPDLVT